MELKDILGLSLNFIGVIILAWYTWETRQMQHAVEKQVKVANEQSEKLSEQIVAMARQTEVFRSQLEEMIRQTSTAQQQTDESIHQTRLSIMPAFVADVANIYEGIQYQELLFILANMGNGVAVNIEIDRLDLPGLPSGEYVGRIPNIIFDRITILDQKASTSVGAISRYGEDQAPAEVQFVPFLHDSFAVEVLTLHIRFLDIEGNSYTQEVQMGKGGCKPGPVKPRVGRLDVSAA